MQIMATYVKIREHVQLKRVPVVVEAYDLRYSYGPATETSMGYS